MNNLFEVRLDIDENDSTKFIGRLKKTGFQKDNYSYIANHPGGTGGVYHLIKLMYEKEVIKNGSSMIEFLKRLNAIIQKKKLLSYKNYDCVNTDGTTTTNWMMNYYNSYIK